MADKDITNQQILDALTIKFDKRFDGLEQRFDSLEEMLASVKSVVVGISDDMATSEELHEDFDNLELRLGRRIDATFSMKVAKTTR